MNEDVKKLIAELLTNPDPDVRRNAAEDLGAYKDKKVITVLSVAMQDESKGVVDAVTRSLANIGGIDTARSIVHYVVDENISTRNLAAKILVKIGEPSVSTLIQYLKDPDKDSRKQTIDILGEIKSKESTIYLLPLLKDPDNNVIVSTLEALGNIGSVEAIQPIINTIEQYPFARIVAIEALGKIGGNKVKEYLERKFREAIIAGNYESIYMFSLLDALGIVGDAETLDMLLANYDTVETALRDVLLHVIVVITERLNLEYKFDDKVRNDLLHALHSDNYLYQLSAAKALVQFTDTTVTRELLGVLGISEELDFVIIAQMSNRSRVFQIAVECLEDENIKGKIQIVMLIGKLAVEYVHSYKGFHGYRIELQDVDNAFNAIIKICKDINQPDWEIVVETLFRLDCKRASEFMMKVMDEMDSWSKVHIIDQLGNIPSYSTVSCIEEYINDENEMVRESATYALQIANQKIGKMKQRNTTGDIL